MTLQKIGIRKSATYIDIPVLYADKNKFVDRDNLHDVIKTYLTNEFLQAFGFKKIILPEKWARSDCLATNRDLLQHYKRNYQSLVQLSAYTSSSENGSAQK